MREYDSLLDLYYDLDEPEQLLLDADLKERFVYTDFKVMRVALFTTSIPPPQNEVAGTIDIAVSDGQQVGTYQCVLKLKHEEICGRYFKSERAFNKHMLNHYSMNKHQCQVNVYSFVQINVLGASGSSRTSTRWRHM